MKLLLFEDEHCTLKRSRERETDWASWAAETAAVEGGQASGGAVEVGIIYKNNKTNNNNNNKTTITTTTGEQKSSKGWSLNC